MAQWIPTSRNMTVSDGMAVTSLDPRYPVDLAEAGRNRVVLADRPEPRHTAPVAF